MYVSARQAARILGTGREAATRVLAAGLAGHPVWTTTSLLYERAAVEALAGRELVSHEEVARLAPAGLLVGRLDPRCRVAAGPWQASQVTTAMVRILLERHGTLPVVTTVAGFVLDGHEVRTATSGPGGMVLGLGAPDTWFDPLRECRVATPPGNHLLLMNQPVLGSWQVRPAGRRAAAG